MAFGIGVNKSTGNAAGRPMGARSPDGFSLSSNAVGKSIGGWLQNQALPWFSNLASQVDPNLGAAINTIGQGIAKGDSFGNIMAAAGPQLGEAVPGVIKAVGKYDPSGTVSAIGDLAGGLANTIRPIAQGKRPLEISDAIDVGKQVQQAWNKRPRRQ
jgi:hypothetical protein